MSGEMVEMPARSPGKRVLWVQVCGLAAVQGAILLTWTIYNLYLRQLLVEFGFPAALATTLLVVENLLAAGMEPLMGSLSDRAQRWLGNRFLWVAGGVILASACFILIPAVLIFGASRGPLRFLLPGMLVAWALAMTVFRSPALSLLGRYAFATRLPQAASILTLVGGVAGAMGPLTNQFILGLGPMFAFGLGSFVLLGAAAVLQWTDPNRSVRAEGQAEEAIAAPEESTPAPKAFLSWQKLGLVFGAGVGVGLGFRLSMQNFPKILEIQVPDAEAGWVLGAIFVALACAAIPSGTLAIRLGNRRAMILGAFLLALACGFFALSSNSWMATIAALAFGASFSLVANGTIPFALSMVPANKGGLGTGMYFSGGAIATSVFSGILRQSDAIAPVAGVLLGAVAFLSAGGLVGASALLRSRPQ